MHSFYSFHFNICTFVNTVRLWEDEWDLKRSRRRWTGYWKFGNWQYTIWGALDLSSKGITKNIYFLTMENMAALVPCLINGTHTYSAYYIEKIDQCCLVYLCESLKLWLQVSCFLNTWSYIIVFFLFFLCYFSLWVFFW